MSKLDPVFENHLWQTQAEIQVWLVTSPLSHTPNIFSSVLDDLQKWPLWGVGGTVPPQSPPWRRPWIGRDSVQYTVAANRLI